MRTQALTVAAMTAFAANSLLCRLALGSGGMDAASFTSLRAIAAGVTLFILARLAGLETGRSQTNPVAALSLFAYLALFSFAYLSLPLATGALILFGAVQLTMFGGAIHRGERFSIWAWAGLALAIAGLVYLLAPGLTAPDPLGAAMMAGAGIAWGIYSLNGSKQTEPLAAAASNFIYCIPLCLLVSAANLGQFEVNGKGVLWAILSGAVASGLGYVAWYAALNHLKAMTAATVQLSVPVITALAGVFLLAEALTRDLLVASAAILGGITLVLYQQQKSASA